VGRFTKPAMLNVQQTRDLHGIASVAAKRVFDHKYFVYTRAWNISPCETIYCLFVAAPFGLLYEEFEAWADSLDRPR
jgi:hypothetical protein